MRLTPTLPSPIEGEGVLGEVLRLKLPLLAAILALAGAVGARAADVSANFESEGAAVLPPIAVLLWENVKPADVSDALFSPAPNLPALPGAAQRFEDLAEGLVKKHGPLVAIRSGDKVALVSMGPAAKAALIALNGGAAQTTTLTPVVFRQVHDQLARLDYPGVHATLEAFFDLAARSIPAPTGPLEDEASPGASAAPSLIAKLRKDAVDQAAASLQAAFERNDREAVAIAAQRLRNHLNWAPGGTMAGPEGLPSLGVEPSPQALGALKARFREALVPAVRSHLGNLARGWDVLHVEKMSFPFQVERQANIWQPEAHERTRSNQRLVRTAADNPEIAKGILSSLGWNLSLGPEGVNASNDDSVFQDFHRILRQVVETISYDWDGALVNVGWGSGDHVTASGYVPLGPQSLSVRLSDRLAEIVFDPKANPALALWVARFFPL